jgi:hypothetical protein
MAIASMLQQCTKGLELSSALPRLTASHSARTLRRIRALFSLWYVMSVVPCALCGGAAEAPTEALKKMSSSRQRMSHQHPSPWTRTSTRQSSSSRMTPVRSGLRSLSRRYPKASNRASGRALPAEHQGGLGTATHMLLYLTEACFADDAGELPRLTHSARTLHCMHALSTVFSALSSHYMACALCEVQASSSPTSYASHAHGSYLSGSTAHTPWDPTLTPHGTPPSRGGGAPRLTQCPRSHCVQCTLLTDDTCTVSAAGLARA